MIDEGSFHVVYFFDNRVYHRVEIYYSRRDRLDCDKMDLINSRSQVYQPTSSFLVCSSNATIPIRSSGWGNKTEVPVSRGSTTEQDFTSTTQIRSSRDSICLKVRIVVVTVTVKFILPVCFSYLFYWLQIFLPPLPTMSSGTTVL